MIEFLKAVLFGIIEGITEWLPVSSTGHLNILQKIAPLNVTDSFYELFKVVIQLGAIMAVVVRFFHKLWPFSSKKSQLQRNMTWNLWFKVIVAVLPSAVLGLLFDDFLEAHLNGFPALSVTLIFYGIIFIFVEKWVKSYKITDVHAIDYRTALLIGAFQCLSLIPGTSRSGATILGALLLGVSRSAGAEFSFFLAIPTMLGASGLKLVKFLLEGNFPTQNELLILLIGCVSAFFVSILVIRALMDFVRKHSFAPFGIYRIVLGAVVLGWFLLR